MKRGPTKKCGPVLHHSVDLLMQTYTEPVPSKYPKKTRHKINVRGYTDIFTVQRRRRCCPFSTGSRSDRQFPGASLTLPEIGFILRVLTFRRIDGSGPPAARSRKQTRRISSARFRTSFINSRTTVTLAVAVDVIYTSRAYATMSVSVCPSVTKVNWRIMANIGFKFRSKFTAHCRREEGSSQQHLALC